MQSRLENFKLPTLDIKEVGTVKEVKYGIVKVDGLPSCVYGQLVQFGTGTKGIVIGFNIKEVVVIALSGESKISVGDSASSLAELVNIPVGEEFLGRIVNSLGEPIDGKKNITAASFFPVFNEAPGVIEREPISEALRTGIKILDLVIPIGKGQRELIIGDRQTGKSTIALDTIINQKDKDVVCIYCWVGGPQVALKKILATLEEKEALAYTIVVVSSADTSAAEQYLAPYAAATLGEYFMSRGQDVLVAFDDLTKHAWIYRQISLLLERSPGREAYPGDIFYLHSQLMERAGQLHRNKGHGSMTFLPIVETLQGDITGYVQSNLISMTDGQIYISGGLFREGFKPAVDLGLSVSRIGSRVQCPALREVSEGLRAEYISYREMLRLTKLRTRLSTEAVEKMRRGEVLWEILMQPNNQPLSLEEEIIIFYAFKRRILEVLPPPALKKFIDDFYGYLCKKDAPLIKNLKETGELNADAKAQLNKILVEFFRGIKAEEDKTHKEV
ncbi:MAG: F0F1 ATP synthase subunit alpha [Candidatus Omnitrophica bacterium]|nr:F0F1 ATP synthase subunit alpha [Candidatus Omnitrophota bacterium]